MARSAWLEAVETSLAHVRDAGLHRRRRVLRPLSATHVEIDGRRLINFSSNDYLGLTHAPQIIATTANAMSAGSGAAALIAGYGPAHATVEAAIAAWKGAQHCALLPSGYQANFAAVQALAGTAERAGRGVRFLMDKLVHASLVDAVRSTGAGYRVFPHNGIAKLRRLLAEAPAGQLQVVVTESIFSMDGDAADLPAIAELKDAFDFALLLDEAHASGVYGPHGAGLAAEQGLTEKVDLSVVTLSKALGVSGGAICGNAAMIDAVVNFGRAYIYTTNVPASIANAVTASVRLLSDEPWRAKRVRDLARHVRRRLHGAGHCLPPGDSPIVPILFEGETAAVTASAILYERGLYVVAVRPPTVPRGTSRLRVTLSSEHTDDEIERLLAALTLV